MKSTHISVYELLKKVPNRFLLAIAASRRARQVKDGAVPLVEEVNHEQAVISSLYEILEGKVGIKVIEEKERKSVEAARKKAEAKERDKKEVKTKKEVKVRKKKVEKGRKKKRSRSLAA